MPESGMTRGGITTGATGTIIDGTTAKTAGIGGGELKGTKPIVPSTNSTGRSREHTGSIATNIRIVTIAASSPVLSSDAKTVPLTSHGLRDGKVHEADNSATQREFGSEGRGFLRNKAKRSFEFSGGLPQLSAESRTSMP